MPEMELFGANVALSLISGIWTRLFGYMFWPGDEARRRAHCSKPLVEALASIEQRATADPDYADAYHVVHGVFREEGGWAAVANAASPNLAERGRPLRTAAAVLDVIRRTPKEDGSLRRAFHVVSATARNYGLIGNRTDIKQAWKNHRCVAHLGVALVFLGEPHEGTEFEDPRRLGRFVAIARDYQLFATSYKPPRQQTPLVPHAEIWSFPVDLQEAATRRWRLRQSLPQLPNDMLAASRAYRAPRLH